MIKQLKKTFMNWATENTVLALTIIGAIALPLGLAVIIGVLSLVTWLLSFLFGAVRMATIWKLYLFLGQSEWNNWHKFIAYFFG